MNSRKLQPLISRLGHEFKDLALLDLALTHRSYEGSNNERLEFLGDSILNCVIAEALFQRFAHSSEGELSRLRALMVKGETLAEIAREMTLGDYLNLGEGELKSGGFRRASILADAVEAIIGAIYLDAGMVAAKASILRWYAPRLADLSLDTQDKDPKTQLQEWLQARKQPLPEYRIVDAVGDLHCQTFTVECHTGIVAPTNASATNRRRAEKAAAALMLTQLENQIR